MSLINSLNAVQKLVISVVIAVIGYYLTGKWIESSMLHVLVFWDVFSIFFLLLNWITFFTIKPQQIREEAAKQDEGRIAAFIIVLVATLAALLAVLSLLLGKNENFREISFSLITAFGGMVLSWGLMHTIFTIRYAHMYYSDKSVEGGLIFPNEKHPDFLDFAYYAFVIGMTFQVSDISVSSRKLRRLTLLHSLLAFAFNTIIVALTVNVIAGFSRN